MKHTNAVRRVPEFEGEKLAKSNLLQAMRGVVSMVLLCGFNPAPIAAETPVALGSAGNFTVLAGSTVTNTGPTVVVGDLGVSPGTAVTGFPPGTLIGTQHAGDPVAAQAQLDLTAAYNDAAGRSTAPISVSGDLGGLTLFPGLYKSTSSLSITGNLTLDAQGDPNAVFIFQIASTLITSSGSQIILAGGAQASNIFWQVGSSATLGSNSIFKGIILANNSITLNTGASLEGKALAINGAVTLDTNNVGTGIDNCPNDPLKTDPGVCGCGNPETCLSTSGDLSLTKDASVTDAAAPALIDYTITVRNNGPDTQINVTVTDQLPANTEFVSSDHPATVSGQTVTISIGTMANGATEIVHLIVRATGPVGPIENIATVDGSGLDSNPANDTDDAIVNIVSVCGTDLVPAFQGTPVVAPKGNRSQIKGILNVCNIGNRTTRVKSFVQVYLSDDNTLDSGDTLLKTLSVKPVFVNQCRRVKISALLPEGSSASGKFLLFQVDATDVIGELREDNNVQTIGPM